MKRFMNKKVATIGLAAGLALGAAGAAFAYYVSTGSGTGQASTGSSSNVTVVQDSIRTARRTGDPAWVRQSSRLQPAIDREYTLSVCLPV